MKCNHLGPDHANAAEITVFVNENKTQNKEFENLARGFAQREHAFAGCCSV
jgi:hypothetical protein